MESRNWIGLGIIIAGVVIHAIGWMYLFWVQVLSFVLIFAGVFIFATQKFMDHLTAKEFSSRDGAGKIVLPGDVHGSSGWASGGRSDSWGGDGGGGD